MYGEMDFKDIETWQKSRDDIVLESLLTSGHFADIFLANIRSSGEQVVAKTLKSMFKFDFDQNYCLFAKI